MRTIAIAERRARLGVRHGLATPGPSPEDAADALVGLHSSDPSTIYLSARARVPAFEVSRLEKALYEQRSLVRMLGMRRTLFVVSRHVADVMDAACTKALAATERRRLIGMLESQAIVRAGTGARWLERVATKTLAALQHRGEATARQLTADVPELGERLSFGAGRRWAGTMGVSTRVLFLLAAEGAVVRTRPLGSWVSGQYRWARTVDWLGEPLEAMDERKARAELARRYLRSFGPVTLTDLRWWTGWTAKPAASALADAGAVDVKLEDGFGYALAEDLDRPEPPGRWVAALPGLDSTVMGWKERSWYVGAHAEQLFDRAGNAGPTLWADGRVVGGWIQRRDGDVAYELLVRVPPSTKRAIEAELDRLRDWLGGVRVTPRFRTPLESRLAKS